MHPHLLPCTHTSRPFPPCMSIRHERRKVPEAVTVVVSQQPVIDTPRAAGGALFKVIPYLRYYLITTYKLLDVVGKMYMMPSVTAAVTGAGGRFNNDEFPVGTMEVMQLVTAAVAGGQGDVCHGHGRQRGRRARRGLHGGAASGARARRAAARRQAEAGALLLGTIARLVGTAGGLPSELLRLFSAHRQEAHAQCTAW